MKLILHFFLIIILTITTQIGGIIYVICIIFINRNNEKYRLKRLVLFSILYLVVTFLIVPNLAPIFGREKIKENKNLTAHFFIIKLFNRNYVKPELNTILENVLEVLKTNNPELKLIYLDANFPFFDGFPLLPHLSHKDGKKIDVSFIYEDNKGNVTNLKTSNSGYGVFENPMKEEFNQAEYCKQKGYWQYDFTKYMTFGSINDDLKLSEKTTRLLIEEILKHNKVSKLFIEPHLKNRLKLHNKKIRFHGCRAVRHDDHIHFQIN